MLPCEVVLSVRGAITPFVCLFVCFFVCLNFYGRSMLYFIVLVVAIAVIVVGNSCIKIKTRIFHVLLCLVLYSCSFFLFLIHL